jgi:hypothetical protein
MISTSDRIIRLLVEEGISASYQSQFRADRIRSEPPPSSPKDSQDPRWNGI